MRVERVIAEMAESGSKDEKSSFGMGRGIGSFSPDDEMSEHD
jgi:hypothetical protein